MDEWEAREIFGFNEHETITTEKCKKKYKRLALKYHPDKNPSSEDASEKFSRLNNAYQFLTNETTQNMGDYKGLFMSFVKNILGGNVENNETLFNVYLAIEKKITSLCGVISQDEVIPIVKKMVDKIDKDILIKMVAITNKYSDVFHISELLSNVLNEVIEEKNSKESCIYLHPFIDDLFDEKLYKLTLNGETFIVPLWHHELVYDENIHVKCVPILSDNIHIDKDNNIIVSLTFTKEQIFDLEEITFELGEKTFSFERNILKLKKIQTYKIKGKGISTINTVNIFDVSKKGDIIVSICII